MENQNSTPDSWDQNEEQGAGDKDISQTLSQIKLNADAPSFVPGQNVFAASFVPSTFTPDSAPSTGNHIYFVYIIKFFLCEIYEIVPYD